MDKKFIPIIGMEIHIEPNTNTKMFCSCPQDHFGKSPNTQVCPICLGLPGALPYANREGIVKTIKLGLALGSTISKFSKFYRKNYFYPDLPKGFQTSQLDSPFCLGGSLGGKQINHIHLEEDAGKLVHLPADATPQALQAGETQGKVSLIDFNRSGCVLIEVVTEPVFHETSEVIDFVKELQLIARYLDVGDCDMEKGRMRLEANVSMSQDGSLPNYKVELKNINSFRFLEKAINAELVRQEKALKNGEVLVQETRGYDEVKQTTYSQRTKSEANDYRYFPEADLPPVRFDEKEVEKIKGDLPELPAEKRKIFLDRYKIASDFIEILVSDKSRADYFEESVKLGQEASLSPKVIADLMINKKLDSEYPEPAGLVRKIAELTKVEYASNDDLEKAVKSVVTENEKAVKDYKEGNGNVIGFLIGMVQKKLQGKGNAQLVRAKLLENLQS